MYLYGKSVLAAGEIVCDVKAVRTECILAVAYRLTVYIYIVCGLNSVEFYVYPSA